MSQPVSTVLTPFISTLAKATAAGSPRLVLTGCCGAASSLAIALLSRQFRRQLLVVTHDQAAADEVIRELAFFEAAGLCTFPAWEAIPFEAASPHPDISGSRLETLFRVSREEQATVVAPVAALMQKVLSRSLLGAVSCSLAVGEEPEREKLLESLVKMGYTNCQLVEERGSFAVRGGLLDIFPPSLPQPVRIEFFGDSIESIRSFDPLTQRSQDHLERLTLLPSRELILDSGTLQAFMPRLKERADQLDIPADRRRSLAAELQEAHWPAGIEYLQPLFHPDLEPLTNHLHNPLLIIVGPEQVREAALRLDHDLALGERKALDEGRLYPEPSQLYLSSAQLMATLEGIQRVEIPQMLLADDLAKAAAVSLFSEGNSDLKVSHSPERQHALGPLAERLQQWLRQGWQTIIVCHQPTQAERMRSLLEGYRLPCAEAPSEGIEAALATAGMQRCVVIGFGLISRGCRLPEQKIAIIAEEELFGKRTRRKSGVSVLRTKQILASLAELKPGDAMVHIDHGIGIYRGLHHLKTGTVEGDFLLLEYAGADKLYLPIDRLGLVQRYVGGEGATPQVARLGGSGWEKSRKKARKNIEELASDLLEIYAKRQAAQGFSFSPPDEIFREFEAAFPWEETPDQLAAIQDVLADMQHSRPMDRLVCGDVGYGKTEVALRAAFKSVLDGKQVAVLVPTTILAQQHFETFVERLKEYPVTVEALSRFRSVKEQKEILARLKQGKVDIIVGTHRLLQKDVAFRDLGLLIVDEEQRFGVKDKERLKQYRASVDIMTLTATPIPRTLHMSMMGIRDLSIIDTPPVDRQAIRTVVARDNDDLVRNAIMLELERNGQVFFVHNRVQSIGLVAERLRRLVPEARIAVAHGQMDEKELEKVMLGFMHGETNLLISTTIIESGLDIPRANTMLVDRADTFGLSQLYQLRGRIGRSTVQGHAYLLIPGAGSISQDARERLRVIQELSELGSGFRIATHDLELRGAGDMLGPRQSGTVADIGFEYYTQLLEEAIANLKGEQLEDRCEPEINLNIPAFIPESYVSDTNQRLVLYKRLVQAESDEEVAEIGSELADRYGRQPVAVETLIKIMGLRIILKHLKIQKLETEGKRLAITFHPRTIVQPDTIISLIRSNPATCQFTPDHRLLVQLPDGAAGTQTIEAAASLLKQLAT